MRVIKDKDGGIVRRVLLLDDGGEPVVPVVRYLGHLIDAGYSPHTACAYGYDLRYLFEFLGAEGVSWQAFGPSTALISWVICGVVQRGVPRSGWGWRWPLARGGCWRRRRCSGCWRRRRASTSGRSPPGSPPSRRTRCAGRATPRWPEFPSGTNRSWARRAGSGRCAVPTNGWCRSGTRASAGSISRRSGFSGSAYSPAAAAHAKKLDVAA